MTDAIDKIDVQWWLEMCLVFFLMNKWWQRLACDDKRRAEHNCFFFLIFDRSILWVLNGAQFENWKVAGYVDWFWFDLTDCTWKKTTFVQLSFSLFSCCCFVMNNLLGGFKRRGDLLIFPKFELIMCIATVDAIPGLRMY